MRRYTFIFFIHLTSFLTAQPSFTTGHFTKEERDSLQKSIASPAILEKLDRIMKREDYRRDSIIKNHIINTPISDFDARDTEGVLHRPAMYRGRVWLIHFWNFWDNSFQYEIPDLNAVVDSLRGEGVEVLSFMSYQLGESEKKYMLDRPIRFPIIENSEGFGNQLFGAFFPRPYIAIIDKRGVFRYFYDGQKLHLGFKFGHRNELLEENKKNQPTYDFMEKVKLLLKE